MRIRTIKPEWWNHRVMSRQSERIQLFAIGLLNYADDDGLFWADPILIRNALRPYDTTTGVVRECLGSCEKLGYIEIRNHPTEGEIGFIVNFKKHQVINKPSPSRIRDFWVQADSRSAPGVLPEDSVPTPVGKEGKGKEGNIAFPEQPVKAKTVSETQKDGLPNLGAIFIDRYRIRRGGVPYVPDGADKGAITRLRPRFGPGKEKLFRQVVDDYLGDPDPRLCSAGHPLKLLPEKVQNYLNRHFEKPKPELFKDEESNDPDPYELESANGSGADARPEAGDAGAGSDAVSPGLGKARDGAA